MPILQFSDDYDSRFGFGIQGWLQNLEEKEQWQEAVTCAVQYAFVSKSCALITISPAQWSIGQSLPEPRYSRIGQNRYLINRIEHCSLLLLAEIAESEDFHRGLLLLSATSATDEPSLLENIAQIGPTSDLPARFPSEALMLLDDGRQLYWFHPTRDVKTLKQQVLTMMERLHWSVSADSR
jgi:hypothetical protein